jgi:hypothetical protein
VGRPRPRRPAFPDWPLRVAQPTSNSLFELGYGREHREHEPRHGVTAGPDVDALGHGDEANPGRVEVADVGEDIQRGPAEAVQLPDERGVELAAPGKLPTACRTATPQRRPEFVFRRARVRSDTRP